MTETSPSVRILYATATGTAEDVAEYLTEVLSSCGTKVYACHPIDEYQISSLPADAAAGDVFVFVVATCGDGEAPAPMRKFWQFLRRRDLPAHVLRQLRFAVFGLGDRAYVKFNAAARKLSLRLSDLGASMLLPLGLGDESQDGGYDKELIPWTQHLLNILLPSYVVDQNTLSQIEAEPRVHAVLTSGTQSQSTPGRNEEACPGEKWGTGQALGPSTFVEPTLFEATLAKNTVLTNSNFLDDEREVQHLELDVSGSPTGCGLDDYMPGDIIHVMPRNRDSAVDALLQLTGLDGSATIDVKAFPTKSRPGRYQLNITMPCSLRAFASSQLDLSAIPRRRFFARLAPFATSAMERDKLKEFASTEAADDLIQYAYREKRTVLMVLRDFPSARPPLRYLIDMIPRLKSRPFSIASSSRAHSGKIHICAAIVRYTTPLRFSRVGVCSAFFLRLRVGDIVPVFLERGTSLRFRKDRPAILVGPGTGVAPMRSYLHSCNPEGPENVLFFGCRTKDGDFLYKSEWVQLQRQRRLGKLVVAFSRSILGSKVYVQHKMREHGALLWSLVHEKEAHVYVAGSAGSMPKAVRETLSDICMTQGHLTATDAEAFVRRMELRGRLQVECW